MKDLERRPVVRIRIFLTTLACLALLRTAAGADSPGPGAPVPQAAPQISAEDAQAEALLHQGRSTLKQRLKSSGEEAQRELDSSEREYQHTADKLDAIRTQELLGTVLPGVIEGSVRGSHPPLNPSPPLLPVLNTPAGPSGGGSGSASARNLTPLATSCVRQYWDSQVYNWLSFENDCGQAIYLTFIFAHPVGWAMTGSMNLAPGAHSNTGRSNSDINQAGGYDLYVCPANSIPVDLNGNTFTANVPQFLCKPQ